jgi:2-polyprenyl-3-methyl-5-hydroxy-6-metoxy-1,4-benzoquinol methylase
LQRKMVVTQLRRCDRCGLMFRWPKEAAEDNLAYYQSSYEEATVTTLPAVASLPAEIAAHFANTGRDLRPMIELLRRHETGGRLLDYGCSWGYGVHQFRSAGYKAQGFEISEPRARYARENLGVDIVSSQEALPDAAFDIVFTSHVLEHIPNPDVPFHAFARLLRLGGLLLIFVPNGAGQAARDLGTAWGPMIGENHVLALTAEFFARNLLDYGFSLRVGCTGSNELSEYHPDLKVDGEELIIVARRI